MYLISRDPVINWLVVATVGFQSKHILWLVSDSAVLVFNLYHTKILLFPLTLGNPNPSHLPLFSGLRSLPTSELRLLIMNTFQDCHFPGPLAFFL